jgi:hypothetical protein
MGMCGPKESSYLVEQGEGRGCSSSKWPIKSSLKELALRIIVFCVAFYNGLILIFLKNIKSIIVFCILKRVNNTLNGIIEASILLNMVEW